MNFFQNLIQKKKSIKITRRTESGIDKLIVIEKSSFQNEFNLEEYGINLSEEDQLLREYAKMEWISKKSGFERDIILKLKQKI